MTTHLNFSEMLSRYGLDSPSLTIFLDLFCQKGGEVRYQGDQLLASESALDHFWLRHIPGGNDTERREFLLSEAVL